MKRMQFSLVVAGIFLLGAAPMQGAVSTPSNVAAVTTPSAGSGAGAAAVAEWYGPFSSWDNVKSKYGAKGDGVTDDTAAINNALANVGLNGNSPVLFFPAGTYRVTQSLLLKYRVGIEIWGADPDTTRILWDGGNGVTLLRVNGLVDSVLARLTFDGNSRNGIVVDYNFDGADGSYFDAGSTIMDCAFKNGSYGIRGGYSGVGCANNNYRRCRFSNLTYGFTTHNANAFQNYLIDCTIERCTQGVGLLNRGMVHCYRNLFRFNAWDFVQQRGANFGSLVANVSYRSGGFFKHDQGSTEETPWLLKGNTIIDPTNTVPIYVHQFDPMIFVDNIVMQSGATAAVQMGRDYKPDTVFVGNQFTTPNWFGIIGGTNPTRTNFVDNIVVSYSALTPPAPTTWATNLNRAVTDLSATANGAAIQNAVNSAANQPGSVVHIAAGDHSIGTTLTVPGNADIRIVGDGTATKLYWNGGSGSALLKLATPSRAQLKYLQCLGQGNATPLVKVEATNPNTIRALFRDCKWLRGVNADLYMADLPNAMVEQFGLAADYTTGVAWHMPGRGKLRVIGCDGGQPPITFVATNGADLYVETHDTESNNGNKFALVSGAGTVSFVSGKMWTGSMGLTKGLVVNNFSGHLLYGAFQPWNYLNVTGSGNGEVWPVLNQSGADVGSTRFVNNTTLGVTVVQSANQYVSGSILKQSEVGVADAAFVRRMLAQMRAVYPAADAPAAMPAGQVDTIWERVYLDHGQRNVEIGP